MEKNTKILLNNIVASYADEGMFLTREEIDKCRAILDGRLDVDKEVQRIIIEVRRKNA